MGKLAQERYERREARHEVAESLSYVAQGPRRTPPHGYRFPQAVSRGASGLCEPGEHRGRLAQRLYEIGDGLYELPDIKKAERAPK